MLDSTVVLLYCCTDLKVNFVLPQVARQQGQYLASILSKHRLSGNAASGDLAALKQAEKAFKYSHKVL